MESLSELVKKPAVLGVGLAVGLALLYLSTRGASATPADFTLQSQAMAGSTNVQLGAQTTQYDIAALEYQTQLAAIAASNHANDVNANTAITLQAVQNLDNLGMVNAQQELQREQIAGAITVNAANNNAMRDIANIQSTTAIQLAPIEASLTANLANIAASRDVAIASQANQTATAVANINAASRMNVQTAQNNAATTHDIISGVTGLAGAYFGSAMSGVGAAMLAM